MSSPKNIELFRDFVAGDNVSETQNAISLLPYTIPPNGVIPSLVLISSPHCQNF